LEELNARFAYSLALPLLEEPTVR